MRDFTGGYLQVLGAICVYQEIVESSACQAPGAAAVTVLL